MKKVGFLILSIVGLFLCSCSVTQRTAAVYPLVDDAVTNGCLTSNLEIGKRVKGSCSGKLRLNGSIKGLPNTFLVSQGGNVHLTGVSALRAKRTDPYRKAKQVALYEAIKNTDYDVVLCPSYTIEKKGRKIKITVTGFGAKIKSIEQKDYRYAPALHKH